MTFEENQHPRTPAGTFADKGQTSPEVSLRPWVRTSPAIPRVSTETRSTPLSQYVEGAWQEDLDLNPPYQRGSVWTDEQRVDLIRSLKAGIPIGAIFINFRGYDSQLSDAVIDGKQRIEAMRAFRNDELRVPRDWFDDEAIAGVSHDLDTVVWSDLSDRAHRVFNNLTVPHIRTTVETVGEEAEIFRLINTAGTAQTPETIARAAEVETS